MVRYIIEVSNEEAAYDLFAILKNLQKGKPVTLHWSEKLERVIEMEKGIITKIEEHRFKFNPNRRTDEVREQEFRDLEVDFMREM